ncbi:MAG: NAD-dependent DNA ligase LigA [Candidatus Omnitrophica bacterium]|nr:NAD-dependent DNA ligase LigA [Candidatus Omnitrophota bacterium]
MPKPRDRNIEKAKKEIDTLKEEIRRADRRYYILNDPEISDKEYDELLAKLKKIEERNPELITEDSPTQRVAQGLSSGFASIKHREKMLSLDNTYTVDELKEWENKIKRMLEKDVKINYFVEPKIDGVSCALRYEKGNLTLCVTRGDGDTGEDVTANIKTIRSIPLSLDQGSRQEIEVRGEVYMSKKDFESINQQRIKENETVFANPRNAASGSLKLLDSSLVAKRKLRCLIHSFGWAKGYDFKTHKEFLETIASWGLPTDINSRYCKNMDEVIEFCLKWEGLRDSLDYEVDGMVVKVNDFGLQKELGTTLKSPRWAVAYKFPAHQATTKIARIDFGVGRTGIITPVALLEPVECGGVTISRATLHNFDEIKRLDVREKDTVLIERAGDVIPKIIKVIKSKRKGNEIKVKIPKECPVCKGIVTKEKEDEVYLYCINPECPAQLKRSLLHFCQRTAMDIEGMGESIVDELVDRSMVKSIGDIYALTKEDLLKLPLFKEKKAFNLISAIESSKDRPLSRFIYGLGIKHVGEKAAMILSARYKDIDAFFRLKVEDLELIPEIGPVMAASIVRTFSLSKIKALIRKLQSSGLNLKDKFTTKVKSPISGKVFVFTGEMKSLSRNQAREKVISLGGDWSSSVSKNIDFIVAGENPGSKFKKAKELNLNIISEKDFLKLIS